MNISATLYQLRTARGLSQEALAEALDVSRQAVSKWETGAAVPDVDKIVQLSEFYGVTTDFLLKGDPAGEPSASGPRPEGGQSGPQTESAGAQPGPAPFMPSAGAAAVAPPSGARDLFIRLWSALCLVASAAAAVLFCALWFMSGYWFASTFAHMGVVAVVGTLAAAFGVALFELGVLVIPQMKRRRVFFYSYAVWALALLPCCAVSGVINFIFSNWLWWRLETALGSVAAAVFRIGLAYLLPFILYGGVCTSARDFLSERWSLQNSGDFPEAD